ncbi:gluconokinase [Jeotgalibacillus proteolyticus]|uniref:Gluconokinase n=1 Tax=Jeotgalibacillus proteolyticus TaxID=2082395 RepID=A0A2S5GAD4_9BACL|nr:gluconokinase [Jeotgalibacillus proteolyticus]PPA69987.1 gluconokinase [Jeotgalibacillus proteolyticus]
MKQTHMIGVDIGTTSTKAVVFSKNGEFISKENIEYPLYTPHPGTAEQDPDQIFEAVQAAIRGSIILSGLPKEAISFVSFSSAMHSVIAVDEAGTPLTKSITWADNRSNEYTKQIKAQNGHEIYLRTGTPIHPMSPLSKLAWLHGEQPDLCKKAAKFISIKEYVFFKLFGAYEVDFSIASATGMFNLKELDWDQEALRIAGVTADKLSAPVDTTHYRQGLSLAHASKMGLAADTPFFLGASDGVLSNLGVNAIDKGSVAVTIGTSGAIRTVTDKPVTDPKGRIFCYALTKDRWVIGGPVNNGGMIFRWLRDELCQDIVKEAITEGINPYDALTKLADQVSPGSHGLLFHPYMAGERAPIWDANARGSFFGLGLNHKKEDMVRAVLEGILFNLYSVLLALEELIGEPKRIQATGGFAQSGILRQMMADIFDQEVVVPESFESSCFGACVLGLYARGEMEKLEDVSRLVGSVHTHQPNKEAAAVYQQVVPMFIRLSRMFSQEFENIAKLQKELS